MSFHAQRVANIFDRKIIRTVGVQNSKILQGGKVDKLNLQSQKGKFMASMKQGKCILGILTAVTVLCSGCGNGEAVSETGQPGEDLDVVGQGAGDNQWYMSDNVYTDDAGRRLEVSFDDYGMLDFSVDGLSLYYTNAADFQQENNWQIYTCDDGTVIVYYPGEPAHLEISDGEYAGVYEEGGDKVK